MTDRDEYWLDRNAEARAAEAALSEVLDIVEQAETNCNDDEPRPGWVDTMLDDLLMTARRGLRMAT